MKRIGRSVIKRYVIIMLTIFFWLIVWELITLSVDNELLLPSPAAVLITLFGLVQTFDFWQTILYSSLRILYGCALAIISGAAFAVVAYRLLWVKELLALPIKIMETIPVACFIIIALLWLHPQNLSVLVAYMMVLPMIYSNVLQGLKATDEKLLQMAQVFRIGIWKKIKAIYIPSVKPFFLSAVSVGIGFGWKAGIATEIIANSNHSIGERLYEAKLYWMTREQLAWAIVIILISIFYEKAAMLILRLLHSGSEH